MVKPTGMREAHAHVFQLGRSMSMVDLSACASQQEMLDRLGEAAGTRPGMPVLAHGARPEGFADPGWPGLDALEASCAGAAVWAWCFDHHALLASRAALRAARLDEDSPDPDGGVLERDAAGLLNGVCKEAAALTVWEAAPEPSMDERVRLVRSALERLSALGFAEVHDLKAQPWLPEVVSELDRAGELACDLVLWPLVEHLGSVAATRGEWESRRVRMGGGKIFVDGTLNSRTAWMTAPYADGSPAHPSGMALMTEAEIDRAFAACADAGVPLAAHAIGDAAVRAVLDGVERADAGRPHRIEHAEFVDEADVERFVRLGAVASVQPCHLLADIEALERAVPDRLDRVLPLRDLIDAGCVPGRIDGAGVVFGSDVPIVRADPKDSIQAAVRRTRVGCDRVIGAGQAISEGEAWACFG
ncbi:MAG: amidohydrolase family protein [Planctomycetota bacterium]